MFHLFTALAVAISTMLGAAGATVEVTPTDIANGDAVARVRTALATAEQAQGVRMVASQTSAAELSSRLQSQLRSIVRCMESQGLDEPAMEAIMERVRQRLQVQLEQCQDGTCQYGLEEALRATEQWQHQFEGSQGEGDPIGDQAPVDPQPRPPAECGGPGPGAGSVDAGRQGGSGPGR
ncbi:MAG: hypothetical protein ACP5G7_07835 [Anaerolineae bacterium]